jgi:hypothetical protein
MVALFCLFLALFASPFKSKSRLEAENAALRHQLIILRRKVRGRVRLTNGDRLFFIQLYRLFPSVLKVRHMPTGSISSANWLGFVTFGMGQSQKALHRHSKAGPPSTAECLRTTETDR